MSKTIRFLIVVLVISFSLGVILFVVSTTGLSWRIERLLAEINYALNPPEKVVFVPVGQTLTPPVEPPLSDTPLPFPALRRRSPWSPPLLPHPAADASPDCPDPGAHAAACSSRATGIQPYVPDVEQLRPGKPGDGAVLLGLERRPAPPGGFSQAQWARQKCNAL